MTTLKHPERYNTAKVNAEILRDLADEIEKGDDDLLKQICITAYSATKDEVRDSLIIRTQAVVNRTGETAVITLSWNSEVITVTPKANSRNNNWRLTGRQRA